MFTKYNKIIHNALKEYDNDGKILKYFKSKYKSSYIYHHLDTIYKIDITALGILEKKYLYKKYICSNNIACSSYHLNTCIQVSTGRHTSCKRNVQREA